MGHRGNRTDSDALRRTLNALLPPCYCLSLPLGKPIFQPPRPLWEQAEGESGLRVLALHVADSTLLPGTTRSLEHLMEKTQSTEQGVVPPYHQVGLKQPPHKPKIKNKKAPEVEVLGQDLHLQSHRLAPSLPSTARCDSRGPQVC